MKHGSLFSGIGGFDLAAEWMGWENVFHCEWMEFPRKVLDYHFPNADSHIDICKTDFKKYANKIDILTGGFPCQPFSLAGKRKGTDDERYLWGEMLRAIQEIKPKYVIAENVFGITNIDGGLVFQQVCLDLENEGYEVQPFIIPAAAKNAPHRRDRCWFVGVRNLSNTKCEGLEGYDREREGCTEHRSDKRLFIGTETKFNATNSNSDGFNERNGNDEINPSQGRVNAFGDINTGIVNGYASNTKYLRCENSQQQGQPRCEKGLFKGVCINGNVADTKCSRRIQISKNIQPKKSNGFKFIGNGWKLNATNTNSCGQQTLNNEKRFVGQENRAETFGGNSFKSIRREQGWKNFPTQSPVCGGDDGIPTQLDGITFSKWRAESIKGYGNAIVPQIAYQLFEIIQELNENN
jgi:DNA (cytosine-5)-methyltransferase 1